MRVSSIPRGRCLTLPVPASALSTPIAACQFSADCKEAGKYSHWREREWKRGSKLPNEQGVEGGREQQGRRRSREHDASKLHKNWRARSAGPAWSAHRPAGLTNWTPWLPVPATPRARTAHTPPPLRRRPAGHRDALHSSERTPPLPARTAAAARAPHTGWPAAPAPARPPSPAPPPPP